MTDAAVQLVYFRGEFEIAGKPERLVIVIDPKNRKIVYCDYADNATEWSKQLEERYLSQPDEPEPPTPT